MAATNYPDKIDVALRDRISHSIYFPIPCSEGRKKFLGQKLLPLRVLQDEELTRLAHESEGWNFRDLNKIVQHSTEAAIQNAKKANHFIKMSGKVLMKKYRPCFCPDSAKCGGINMSYEAKRGQIDIYLSFGEILKIFESFNKNDTDNLVANLEEYNSKHGYQVDFEQLEMEDEEVRQSFCYRINPRKILFGLFVIIMICATCWISGLFSAMMNRFF